jgi:hypothetical protein
MQTCRNGAIDRDARAAYAQADGRGGVGCIGFRGMWYSLFCGSVPPGDRQRAELMLSHAFEYLATRTVRGNDLLAWENGGFIARTDFHPGNEGLRWRSLAGAPVCGGKGSGGYPDASVYERDGAVGSLIRQSDCEMERAARRNWGRVHVTIVPAMVRGAIYGAVVYGYLKARGMGVDYAFAGYSSGRRSLPPPEYATETVHITKGQSALLRRESMGRNGCIWIVDNAIDTGETVQRIAAYFRRMVDEDRISIMVAKEPTLW